MYFVYILYSKSLDRYYVGSTNDLRRRLEDNNRGKTKYARQGMPWILMYYETFQTRTDAYNREMEIKGRKSRSYIMQLIAAGSEHPEGNQAVPGKS